MQPALTENTNVTVIHEQLTDDTLAVYIHIPFCRTRCSYCAFNTYTGQSDLVQLYVHALTREIRAVAPHPAAPVSSIFFGGGTPSLLSPHQIHTLLDTCATTFSLTADVEITLEANPGTVDRAYLTALRGMGVNRLSAGMQSANHSELQFFARTHTLDDVQTTVAAAREAGFATLNLDLIYGSPHQTLHMWRASLDAARALTPDHISLYSLSVEDATPLHRWIARGHHDAPDPDDAADMYTYATDYLAAAGYEQIEISNWAQPGHACRHNVHVWHNLPYLGFGAGAHGYAAHTRTVNTLLPATYITRIMTDHVPRPFPLSAATEDVVFLTQPDVIAETMIMGLRLVQEGVSPSGFAARFGVNLNDVYGDAIERLIALELLERTSQNNLRLTQRGRLLGNQVFAEFI